MGGSSQPNDFHMLSTPAALVTFLSEPSACRKQLQPQISSVLRKQWLMWLLTPLLRPLHHFSCQDTLVPLACWVEIVRMSSGSTKPWINTTTATTSKWKREQEGPLGGRNFWMTRFREINSDKLLLLLPEAWHVVPSCREKTHLLPAVSKLYTAHHQHYCSDAQLCTMSVHICQLAAGMESVGPGVLACIDCTAGCQKEPKTLLTHASMCGMTWRCMATWQYWL